MSQPVCRSALTLKKGRLVAPTALHRWWSRAATERRPAEGRS
jgi:hypothetical protein